MRKRLKNGFPGKVLEGRVRLSVLTKKALQAGVSEDLIWNLESDQVEEQEISNDNNRIIKKGIQQLYSPPVPDRPELRNELGQPCVECRACSQRNTKCPEDSGPGVSRLNSMVRAAVQTSKTCLAVVSPVRTFLLPSFHD